MDRPRGPRARVVAADAPEVAWDPGPGGTARGNRRHAHALRRCRGHRRRAGAAQPRAPAGDRCPGRGARRARGCRRRGAPRPARRRATGRVRAPQPGGPAGGAAPSRGARGKRRRERPHGHLGLRRVVARDAEGGGRAAGGRTARGPARGRGPARRAPLGAGGAGRGRGRGCCDTARPRHRPRGAGGCTGRCRGGDGRGRRSGAGRAVAGHRNRCAGRRAGCRHRPGAPGGPRVHHLLIGLHGAAEGRHARAPRHADLGRGLRRAGTRARPRRYLPCGVARVHLTRIRQWVLPSPRAGSARGAPAHAPDRAHRLARVRRAWGDGALRGTDLLVAARRLPRPPPRRAPHAAGAAAGRVVRRLPARAGAGAAGRGAAGPRRTGGVRVLRGVEHRLVHPGGRAPARVPRAPRARRRGIAAR